MSKSVVVASVNINSSCGIVEAEIYDDGEFMMWSPGTLSVTFDSKSSENLAKLFLDNLAKRSPDKANALLAAIGTGVGQSTDNASKKIKRAVLKNEKGWGANVGVMVDGSMKTIRYTYTHRLQARVAVGTHQIGECGRIE